MSTLEMTNEGLHALDQKHYLPTFKRYPIAIAKGEGCYVWDVEGKQYLDLVAGLGVNNLGHAHPGIVDAVSRQAARGLHISNFYVSPAQVELSEMLTRLSGMERVFLTNSGAESVEGALKIARKYAHRHGRGGKVISMHNCFHGRTLATIAMGSAKYQKGFGPMPDGFIQVPFNDLSALESNLSRDVAAVIIEPVQGEGGVYPARKDYLQRVRQLCDREGVCLIFDEIQCGIARTGALFAKDLYGVQPDIMTLAKGLGSGVPIGAILSSERVSSAIDYGDHGTTFGGNPLACAAALATLKIMQRDNVADEAARKGELLYDLLKAHLGEHPALREIRYKGLMCGVEFEFETGPLVAQLLQDGILANATRKHVLRLLPPLIIEDDQLVYAVEQITRCINQLTEANKEVTA